MKKIVRLGLVASAMLLTVSPARADISTGLVAAYPFNGNAADASGNGNDATIFGATLTSDRLGAANSAYSFDGIDDYMSIADSSSLNITGDLTIDAWIRSSVGGKIIFSNMLEVSPHSGYSLRTTSDGKLFFMSGDIQLFGNTSVTTGAWTNVAVTLSGATATTYINGVLDKSGIVGAPTTSSVDQTIGASYTPFYFWSGSLDEVNVYNRALSSSDIQQLYSVPEPSTWVLITISAVIMTGCFRRKWKPSSRISLALNVSSPS